MNYTETYSTIAQQPLIRRDDYIPLAATTLGGISVIGVGVWFYLRGRRAEREKNAQADECKKVNHRDPEAVARAREKFNLEQILPVPNIAFPAENNSRDFSDWPFP